MDLTDEELLPMQFYVQAVDAWFEQDSWVDWEPETLVAAITERLGAKLPDEAIDALLAVKTIRANPAPFYGDMAFFENVVLALNGLMPEPMVLQVASPHEIEAALAVLEHVRHPSGEFTSEVRAYVQAACLDAGQYAYPPRMVRFEPPERRAECDKIRAMALDATLDLSKAAPSDMPAAQAAKLRDIMDYVDAVTTESDDES